MKDKIRGSLIGGAAGDALGYTIEFMGEYGIFRGAERTAFKATHLTRTAARQSFPMIRR